MSAKATVDRYVVTPATLQANLDAARYVADQGTILGAAASAAAALVAQQRPEGVVVAALVPVIQALVAAFPAKLAAATTVAKIPFT
jgi:hypothetical protein